jgi:hypothetical protein
VFTFRLAKVHANGIGSNLMFDGYYEGYYETPVVMSASLSHSVN